MIKKPVIMTLAILMVMLAVIVSACKKNNIDDNISTSTKNPVRTPSGTDVTDIEETPDETIGLQDPGESIKPSSPEKTPSSSTEPKYYIKVNVGAQIVTIYKKDSNGKYTIPYKHFLTSTGLPGLDTPLGKFKIYARYKWMLMVDKSYGQYAVRFNGPILFHSVTYDRKSPDTLKWYEYNKLGYKASHGCVRLRVIDAKWIYDNCENGTVVEVYNGEPDPELWQKLYKQAKLPIPEGTRWDPTDPDPKNPISLDDIPEPTPTPDPSQTVLTTDENTGIEESSSPVLSPAPLPQDTASLQITESPVTESPGETGITPDTQNPTGNATGPSDTSADSEATEPAG